jgi:CheY-like chemotaxis protein
MRVLLVDDEPITRKFVIDLLRQMGIHQIHEVSEGKGALVEAIKFQPDLVLSDIHMEPMDGIEFVKKLCVQTHTLPTFPSFLRIAICM